MSTQVEEPVAINSFTIVEPLRECANCMWAMFHGNSFECVNPKMPLSCEPFTHKNSVIGFSCSLWEFVIYIV